MNFNKISVKNHVFKKISYASVQNPTQRVGFSWAFDTSISYATPKNLKKSYPTRRNFEILREAIPRVGRPLGRKLNTYVEVMQSSNLTILE